MKTKMPYLTAFGLAMRLVGEFSPAVDRIAVAGSLRRKCLEVGDLEIVCIPKYDTDMFGQPGESFSALEGVLDKYPKTRGDLKYRQYRVVQDGAFGPVDLDLFLCTSETWGVNFTLRTGSSDFSKWLVTHRRDGGALPSHLTVKGGRVCQGEETLSTPEEQDFFAVLGLTWIEPTLRTAGRWPKR